MVHGDEPMKGRTNARDHRSTVSNRRRLASATLFATAFLMCMVPIGCAATDESVEAPPQPLESSQPSHRVMPPNIVTALQSCMNEGVSRLSRHSYELSFELQVNENRAIRSIEPQGKRLDDTKIEMCIIRALDTMPMRDLLLPDDSVLDDSASATSQRVLPSSRSLIGNAALLPQVIRFVPIVVSASGVTIVVAVVVVVAVAAVVATMSAECLQEWKDARKECLKQLESNDPDYGVTGGYVNTKDCARGLVAQRCGGNRYDGDGQGARPGRRT